MQTLAEYDQLLEKELGGGTASSRPILSVVRTTQSMTTAPVAELGERMKTGRILHREYCIDLERNVYSWRIVSITHRLEKLVLPGTSFLLPGPSDRRGMREGGYRQPSKRRSHGLAARRFASAGPVVWVLGLRGGSDISSSSTSSKGTAPRPDAAASLIRFRFYLESAKFGLHNVRPQDTLRFETSCTNAREILGFKLSLWVADWPSRGAAGLAARAIAHPKPIDTRDISDRSRPPLGISSLSSLVSHADRQSKGGGI